MKLTTKNVHFCGTELLAIQEKETGKIYTGINIILRNLGFNEEQVRYRREKWLEDKVISKGVQKFSHPSKVGGMQETYCIEIKKLPLALAKIEITPKILKEMPDLSKKLEKYQDECADVLANAFIKKENLSKIDSLAIVNESAKILEGIYREAGADIKYIALLVGNIYKECGIVSQLPPIEMDTEKLYDKTEIAKELGIFSSSGKPHSRAVGAILLELDIDESDKVSVPYTNHGHSGVVTQYKQNVLGKVQEWLEDKNYPLVITIKGSSYKVLYK